jgi:antitoxin VapB
MVTTRTFKSGNSVALRLPKPLGIEAGVEMRVHEERGRYIVEPVKPARPTKKIDLSRIWDSTPESTPIGREAEEFEDIPREWHLLGLHSQ